MDPRITWSKPQPKNPAGAHFATWEGRLVFAMIHPSSHRPPAWLLSLYPSGQTSHARNTFVASEAQAKRFVERWARAHADAIGRPPPPPVPTYRL